MRDSKIEGLRWVDSAKSSNNILQKSKNTSFYRRIGRNRPIALINGSDETVHHEPLPLSRGRLIAIRRVRRGHMLRRYITRETPFVRSSSSI